MSNLYLMGAFFFSTVSGGAFAIAAFLPAARRPRVVVT